MAEKEKKKRSSTKIGGAWCGTTESENPKEYISIKVNEELLPFTITKDSSLTLWAREVTKDTHEKAPQYDLSISAREQQ